MNGIPTSEDTAKGKYIAVANIAGLKAMTRTTGKTIRLATEKSLTVWIMRKGNGKNHENNDSIWNSA